MCVLLIIVCVCECVPVVPQFQTISIVFPLLPSIVMLWLFHTFNINIIGDVHIYMNYIDMKILVTNVTLL